MAGNANPSSSERREKRSKQTAEVFTPPKLVKKILDRLTKEAASEGENIWKNGKTFIDPAAGNGNFLVHVLYRKLSRGHNSLGALQSVYGVDIMHDNVMQCRMRLLKLIQVVNDEEITEDHVRAVFDNIRCLCTKRKVGGKYKGFPDGALDYDFAFKQGKYNQDQIDRWMKWISTGWLDDVDLPVDEETCRRKHIDVFAKERSDQK